MTIILEENHFLQTFYHDHPFDKTTLFSIDHSSLLI